MIVAIIQARVGSTRFLNKVFAPLVGKPFIWHVVERLKYSRKINKILIATTLNKNDDTLAQWAIDNLIEYYRGSEENVLERFYKAAVFTQARIIVRITADDPFKDATIIDRAIGIMETEDLDFVFNNNPPTFPEGLDTEVFTFKALEEAYKNATEEFDKEHVTQYFYKHPDNFRQRNFENSRNISFLRWTVDTEDDYTMVAKIYDSLYKENSVFLMDDILAFLKKNPEIARINSEVPRSYMYKNYSNGKIY